MSRIWATKYGIFEVRNGSVACTELQKPTCHGEKWDCKGCCANNIYLSVVTVRNGVVMDLGYKIWYFEVRNGSVTCTELQKPNCHGEKWDCKGCCANNIYLSVVTVRNGVVMDLGYKIWYFEVRNGSVTCTELQKPNCHGEKWVCHGCCANDIGLSR